MKAPLLATLSWPSYWLRMHFFKAFISFGLLSLFASPLWAASTTKEAVEILYGDSGVTRTDSEGHIYHIFQMNSQPPLQDLIDTITTGLLETSIGQAVCSRILEGKPELLEIHLGMTPYAAQQAARRCSLRFPASELQFVIDRKGVRPQKYTFTNTALRRKYTVVRTNNPDLPLDSWTDAFTNETTFFIYHAKDRSDLNLRFLVQAIAHEMGIYFDGKSWPFGPEWSELAETQKLVVSSSNLNLVTTAALNPSIGTVMAAMRAYKIERQMIREMVSEGKLGPEPLYYRTDDLPFLRLSCKAECLSEFVTRQQNWIAELYQPLLAMAPQFRQRRADELAQSLASEDVIDTLIRSPVSFISMMGPTYNILNLFLTADSPDLLRARSATERMMSSFLRKDLNLLTHTQVTVGSQAQRMDLLTYLSLPLLSDTNTAMAAGPRPRIRTGGTK